MVLQNSKPTGSEVLPELRSASTKLTRLRNLELLGLSFVSGFRLVTVHAAAAERFKTVTLKGIPGTPQVKVMRLFDEFRENTVSASLQASCNIPKERLQLAFKHRLCRLKTLAQRIITRSLPKTIKTSWHSTVLKWMEGTKSRFRPTGEAS